MLNKFVVSRILAVRFVAPASAGQAYLGVSSKDTNYGPVCRG